MQINVPEKKPQKHFPSIFWWWHGTGLFTEWMRNAQLQRKASRSYLCLQLATKAVLDKIVGIHMHTFFITLQIG